MEESYKSCLIFCRFCSESFLYGLISTFLGQIAQSTPDFFLEKSFEKGLQSLVRVIQARKSILHRKEIIPSLKVHKS